MPTYDYVCSACNHRFEEFQSMTSKPLRKCPECKKPALDRLIGAGAGVIFKGSGFYQTDYRSDSYKKAAEKDKPAAESKSETKSESKPEAKSSDAKPSSDSGKSEKKKSRKKD